MQQPCLSACGELSHREASDLHDFETSSRLEHAHDTSQTRDPDLKAVGCTLGRMGFKQLGSPSISSAVDRFIDFLDSDQTMARMNQSKDWSAEGFEIVRGAAVTQFTALVDEAAARSQVTSGSNRRRRKKR